MTPAQKSLIAPEGILDLLQKVSTDLDQMGALFVAIHDRAADESGTGLALHFETLARIGVDIAERNGDLMCDTICLLRDVIALGEVDA
ncbi:hypothetical protein [Achromobacter animicus]|uniref:hypothetical protein n=1 Tax=Achromobacter animicus TaxID=1389935 RepID=UPI0028AEB69A|nr:hypothetical protein [Achromobacter animicus]